MANFQRTKYFAVRLDSASDLAANDGFNLRGATSSGEQGEHYDTTPLRDSRHQVQLDVSKVLGEGERWVICQTTALIEAEDPRPPMRITEYR